MAEVKILREFFDIMKSKGRVLDEATLAKPSALTIESFVARKVGGDAADITRAEKGAIKAFTTDVLDQLRKANDGKLSPYALVQAEEAYTAAAVRRFGPGDEATKALTEFKASVKAVLTESYGNQPAKVEALAEARTPAGKAQRRAEAGPAPATPSPSPSPAAATPSPSAAGAEDTRKGAYDHDFVAREKAAQAVKAQDSYVGIRDGMASSRTGAAKGLLRFDSATNYADKKDGFTMLDGGKIGDPAAPDNLGTNVFNGVRPSGWIAGRNTPYEMASQTSHILTRHTIPGRDIFQEPAYLLYLRDYVAAGKFDQKVPPVGVEGLADTAAAVKKAAAEGRSLTDTEIQAGLDKWIEALKKRFEQNKAAGMTSELDKDGLRTIDDIRAILENREMTPLAFDGAVVQNAPGTWLLEKEWTKIRSYLNGDLQLAHLTKLREDLNKLLPLENTAQFDGEGMRVIIEKMKLDVIKVRDFTDKYPHLLTDAAKYDLDKADAIKAGKPFTQPPPAARTADEVRKDLEGGKILSEGELTSMQQHFFGNQFKAQSREYARAFQQLLKADNTVDLNVDEAGGINEQLNKLKPIINQKNYRDYVPRSASGTAHDRAAEAAIAAGDPVPVRKIDDIKNDIINGDKVTEGELIQATQHYRAVRTLALSRAEIREIQNLLRREGTSDLIVDGKHSLASTVGGKGLYERFEELRKLEQIPNYQEHYPVSASAKQALADGRQRAPAEILQELISDQRVSRAELYQLEGHYRAGQLRAVVAETMERAVKFSPSAAQRGKFLQELAEGTRDFDMVTVGGATVGRKLEGALQDMRRRISEEENFLRASGNLPLNPPPGRGIHEIVDDIKEGRVSISNPASLSREDAKIFADQFKAYASGEGQSLEAGQIIKELWSVYDKSNGWLKPLGKKPEGELADRFTRLELIMGNSDYKLFNSNKPEANTDIRAITGIFKELQAGRPVSEDQVARLRNFFELWHNKDAVPFAARLPLNLVMPRFWDRQNGVLGHGGMWTGIGATTGAYALSGTLLLTGGVSALTSAFSSSSLPTGSTTTSQPAAGGTNPATSGPTLFQRDTGTGQPSSTTRVGRLFDRFLTGAEGTLDNKTVGAVTTNALLTGQDRTNQAAFLNEVGRINAELRERSPALATENLDALAAQIADRMYSKYLPDQKLTVGEGIDAYAEAVSSTSPEVQQKIGGVVKSLSDDIRSAGIRDRVVLAASATPSAP